MNILNKCIIRIDKKVLHATGKGYIILKWGTLHMATILLTCISTTKLKAPNTINKLYTTKIELVG
jgi:hypothetical protein